MKKKTIVTITGIRPDFIRMRNIFRLLDLNFNHIMVHTGQHYDDSLSQIFFKDLDIRSPDYILETGKNSQTHYQQMSYLSLEIFNLINRENIRPDLILFLGDSNSVMIAPLLFKEGYKIGHIEGGMRSYDRRMPEEVNRVLCDYVSDFIFVYTDLYKERLLKENKPEQSIFVVGNTITEIVKEVTSSAHSNWANRVNLTNPSNRGKYLVADIHRNENLKTKDKYLHLLRYLNELGSKLDLPVKLVKFNRAVKMIEEFQLLKGLHSIELVGPFGFIDYLGLQKNSYAVISDSGTCQEECPLLGVPAVVPRNSTERPESLEYGNSILVGEDGPIEAMVEKSINFIKQYQIGENQIKWLGEGKTSETIVNILKEKL